MLYCRLNMETLVLASTSPRRAQLLESVGIPFRVIKPEADELPIPTRLPLDGLHARLKEVAVAKGREVSARVPQSLVLSADTIVYSRGRVLGKPLGPQDAARMLKLLSGRCHSVLTALALQRGPTSSVAVETTKVQFRTLSEAEIEAYVATGEPLDKAGAYGIQGLGGFLVAGIQGRYDNVVGLPMLTMYLLLQEFGVQLLGAALA